MSAVSVDYNLIIHTMLNHENNKKEIIIGNSKEEVDKKRKYQFHILYLSIYKLFNELAAKNKDAKKIRHLFDIFDPAHTNTILMSHFCVLLSCIN